MLPLVTVVGLLNNSLLNEVCHMQNPRKETVFLLQKRLPLPSDLMVQPRGPAPDQKAESQVLVVYGTFEICDLGNDN